MNRSQYTNEAYDYPPNLRETFNDLGRTISEKVTLLSSANSAAEASAALTAPPSAKPQPKTFNHAIARAALSSSQLLKETNTTATNDDPLANALEKYALAEEKVGEARLNQDAQIQSRFLAGWSTTLHTNLRLATKARKQVDDARLHLDATKARLRSSGVGRGMNPDADSAALTEEGRAEIERREDELVAQTEEAENVMKNVRRAPDLCPAGRFTRLTLVGVNRCSTRRSHCAIWRSSSPRRWSSTSSRTRSSASSRPWWTVCRKSRRSV